MRRRGAAFLVVLVAIVVLGILTNIIATTWTAARQRSVEAAARDRDERAVLSGIRAAEAILRADPAARGRFGAGITIDDAEIVSTSGMAVVRVSWSRTPEGAVRLKGWKAR